MPLYRLGFVGRVVNVPEYFAVLQEGGEAPKVVVFFRIIRKRDSKLSFILESRKDSNFFAVAIGL